MAQNGHYKHPYGSCLLVRQGASQWTRAFQLMGSGVLRTKTTPAPGEVAPGSWARMRAKPGVFAPGPIARQGRTRWTGLPRIWTSQVVTSKELSEVEPLML